MIYFASGLAASASGLVKCQRISILLLGNCARISHTAGAIVCVILQKKIILAHNLQTSVGPASADKLEKSVSTVIAL